MSHARQMFALAAMIIAAAPALFAQDPAPKKEEGKKVEEKITVTAARFERLIDLTPQSVTVVDSKELRSRPMWNVQALLEDVPGASVQRAGGLDGQIVLRGLSSNDARIVLFIDGDRFRGRSFLEYTFLDPNEIDRIEVIRGPAAALYGSDAMNGVVNVITRRAEGDTSQPFALRPRMYAAGFSSANSLTAGRVELEGLGNGVDMLVAVNYRNADDYRSALGRVPNSDFTTRSFTARAGYSQTPTRRFEIIAKKFSVDNGRSGAPGPPLVTTRQDPLKENYIRFGLTQAQLFDWLHDLDSSLYVRNLSTVIRSDTRTAANGNVEIRDTWVPGPMEIGGKLLARSVVANSVLSYGVDFYHEDAPSFEDEVHLYNKAGALTLFSPRAKRVRAGKQANVGALARYDWDPSARWTVSLGGRYDTIQTTLDTTPALGEDPALTAAFAANHSARDSKATGSAGLIFRPIPMLHLVGNVSTAFRSPTTNDKSGSGVVGALNTLPNAELKPESSMNYEAGARLRLPAANLNFTAFRSNYEDLLQFRFLTPTTRKKENIGRAKVEGFEIDGSVAMTQALAWRFNASEARGTNTLTNVPLPYVPPLNGVVALRHTWPADAYFVELADRWSRDKTRIDRTQERPTDGYQVLNFYAGADLGRLQPRLKAYRVTLGVENLTDKAYVSPVTRELIAFPVTFTNPLIEPGRSFSVNFTAGF